MGSLPGLIALGRVGSSSWEVSVDKPDGQHGTSALPQCYNVSLSRLGGAVAGGPASSGLGESGCGLTYAASQEPVTFTGSTGFGNGSTELAIGTVAPDVTYIMVTLADGQQLKLIPVPAYGARLVAYVVPLSDGVIKAVAYLGNGQYLTAVPFRHPGTVSVYGLWLRPGDHVPPTASAVLATGTPGARSGRITGYEGPWGTCFAAAGGDAACVPVARLAKTEVISFIGGAPPQLVSGSAAANVAQIKVTLTSGDIVRVPVVAVGDEKLWAFGLGKGQQVSSLGAYDASGKRVWSGTLRH